MNQKGKKDKMSKERLQERYIKWQKVTKAAWDIDQEQNLYAAVNLSLERYSESLPYIRSAVFLLIQRAMDHSGKAGV